MAREYDLIWKGNLTVKNAQNIADLLLQLLDGKRFTYVSANESCQFMPEVKTGRRLKNNGKISGTAIRVSYDKEEADAPRWAMLAMSYTHATATCSTDLIEDGQDSVSGQPYFSFDGDKVTITNYGGGGNKIYWVFALEKD